MNIKKKKMVFLCHEHLLHAANAAVSCVRGESREKLMDEGSKSGVQ